MAHALTPKGLIEYFFHREGSFGTSPRPRHLESNARGAVVRALASHQSSLGSTLAWYHNYVGVVCCSWFLSCSEGFSTASLVFLLPQKPTSLNSIFNQDQSSTWPARRLDTIIIISHENQIFIFIYY